LARSNRLYFELAEIEEKKTAHNWVFAIVGRTKVIEYLELYLALVRAEELLFDISPKFLVMSYFKSK
jgi:hypothetical protein